MDAFLEQAVTFPASGFPNQHTPFDVLQEFVQELNQRVSGTYYVSPTG